jgi:hypothetical protein
MLFTNSRKAIAPLSGRIQRDLEVAITSLERLAGKDKRAAGHQTSRLVTDFALNTALPVETRFLIVDAVLIDAERNGIL